MSVANSPASAILRVRRLSSRRPSGRRASSSCDCCPSREPDEWTTWTTWVGQRRSAGLRSGVGRQSSKDVCVFLAPTCKLRQLAASRTALHSSSEVARGGRGGRARAPLVRPPNRSSIEHRSNVDISAMFGRVRGAGKATASPRPPRRFDVVALRRLSGGIYAIGAAGVGTYLGVLAKQGQSLIVEIVAAAFFLPFGRHRERCRRPR